MSEDGVGTVRDGFLLLEVDPYTGDRFWVPLHRVVAVKDLASRGGCAVYTVGQDDLSGGARLTTLDGAAVRRAVHEDGRLR